MNSRWADLKAKAQNMRMEGSSIRDIEIALGIPRSTLSGWFRSIVLSEDLIAALDKRHREGLTKAREFASAAHKDKRLKRIEEARKKTAETLSELKDDDRTIELALAMLYLGEGSKTKAGLRLGNADPLILKFYIYALQRVYKLDISSLYFALHLRADQDEEAEKEYWSQTLDCPLSNFRYFIKDPRTAGRPTREGYHGVCLASGGPVEIQRKLMYLAEAFCERAVRA